MATKKPNYDSTKALDELFIYSYKLRKAGIAASVVEELAKAYLMGAPAVSFECSNKELTEDQKKLVELLKENGFIVEQYNTTLVVKNNHLNKLKEELDKYFDNKDNVK